MEQPRRPRPRKRKRRRARRRSGCRRLILLAALALAVIGLVHSCSAPGRPPQTSRPEKNPYAPSDFTMADGYVTCTAVPTRRGVDVSEYQEQIDWSQVRDAGFDFAFIRIGYRGNTTGDIYPDDRARENLAGAREAGLDVGVYFYAQAISPAEAAEEAAWCLDFLEGEQLDLPVVYDWEWVGGTARTADMDRATLTECARTFCDTIEDGGHSAMLYFNPHVGGDLLDLRQLQDLPWWLAQYRDQMDYPWKVDFWQYTEEGSVPGIKGKVDIDLMFLHD